MTTARGCNEQSSEKANCLEIDALNIPVEKVEVELEHPQFGILKNGKSHVRADVHLNLKKEHTRLLKQCAVIRRRIDK